jgi:uncharacterized protein
MKFYHQVILVTDVDLNFLKTQSIKGLILDLDNTLVSEDDRYIVPNLDHWLKQIKSQGFQVFILSNTRRIYRLKDWSIRFGIPALAKSRKPFPQAFKQALSAMKLTAKEVVVIGDSFHTDVLGAWISGCACIQVASLPHKPHWWEKILGYWLHIPFPKSQLLWENRTITELEIEP